MTRIIPNDNRIAKREIRRIGLRAAIRFCFLTTVGLMAFPSAAQKTTPDFITVQAREVAPALVAYGQVEPIALVPVSAAESGVIASLRVRPGTPVRAGEDLAHLTGPAISSVLLQGEADVRSSEAQVNAAEKLLTIDRKQLTAHLATRQSLQQAESTEAQARAALDNAQSRLTSVRQMMTVSAPTGGTVLALNSANGALVSAGQTILTIQPLGGLWLQAMYYGNDLAEIRVGMTGSFAPSDGRSAIPVRVVSIPGTIAAGGGESIALEPSHAPSAWLSGEAGTVTLMSPSRRLVEVPTRALIVNQGKWWVLVHTSHGNHAQEVVPGPARGWNTVLEGGLAPGTEIVVNNAYLLFHSGIAEQYQIPD